MFGAQLTVQQRLQHLQILGILVPVRQAILALMLITILAINHSLRHHVSSRLLKVALIGRPLRTYRSDWLQSIPKIITPPLNMALRALTFGV